MRTCTIDKITFILIVNVASDMLVFQQFICIFRESTIENYQLSKNLINVRFEKNKIRLSTFIFLG